MLKEDWNDFFEIEEVYDETDEADLPTGPCSPKDADEALAACVNTLGRVDLGWMSGFSGRSAGELTHALAGAVFQDPEVFDRTLDETAGWVLRDQYLSGNILTKLQSARSLNGKYHGFFQANVEALEAILPSRVGFHDIGVGIGSPWIPAAYYEEFISKILSLPCQVCVTYYPELHQWRVVGPSFARSMVQNVTVYGTPRMPALKIFEHTLNASSIKIYDQVSRPDLKSGTAQVLNKNETLAAQAKQVEMQTAFREWLGKDPKRVKRVEQIYYDNYVCCVAGRFHGDFLSLPDLNPEVTLYPHQRAAVARIILESDVLLNHAVGSGKTYAMIAGVHERKRMGLSEKNLVVVPNNVLEAFETAHQLLYPADPILVVHPEGFRPARRKRVLERIRDEEFTAIYMAYSSFDMIPMSRQYRLDQKREEIRRYRALASASKDYWEHQKLERMAARQSEKLEKMMTELPPDLLPAFDQLNVTTLAVDEIHNYKNISLHTRTDGVVGMHPAGSKRCNSLYEKVQCVRGAGGGIIFSTGTPLTNSISDLFVLQSYLQPEQLDLLHIGSFDEWISSFAAREAGFEIDVDSRSFRIMTRFSHFHNLPELTSLFANVCDFYSGADSGMGLPKCDGYVDTVVPKSEEQNAYIGELVERTEQIRAGMVSMDEDNLLKVTHDGRAAALDIRLANLDACPAHESTKTWACAEQVFRVWRKYPGTAQLVFCDLGTPKQGFHIYGELKGCLTEMGIPEEEIAFIHDAGTDAKRRKLFAAVNEAKVRVLIGSTAKLGIGVNVQDRLIAIHHLDVPWRPSDMIQREGRLIRQGNQNHQVYRYRYITAGTFDAYSWQILENKQKFIGQFMNSTLTDRAARDVDDTVLTYAEIKALSVGDPLLKTRIEASNRLERAKLAWRQREQELHRLDSLVKATPAKRRSIGERRRKLIQEKVNFADHREKMTRDERQAFGEELLEALAGNSLRERERFFDRLHGFRVLLPAHMLPEKPFVILEGETDSRFDADMRGAKPIGCVQRIEYVLSHLDDRIHETDGELESARRQAAEARRELRKGNRFTEEVTKLSAELMEIDEELNRRAGQDPA